MSGTENSPVDKSADLLTAIQIAKAMHVSASTVKNWVQDGCPIAQRGKGRGSPNYFDLADVRKWKNGKSGKLDPQHERARKDKATADLQELKVAKERRDLIPRAEIEAHMGNWIASCRARLLALPTRLAALTQSCNGLEETKDVATRLIHETLTELSGSVIPPEPDMETTAESDSEPVGGQAQDVERGSERGTGAVENREG